MTDREKVINQIEVDIQMAERTGEMLVYVGRKTAKDALVLLKEQEEHEKKICKEMCDFIRGTCSTDTYADKEFVCHEIQKCFMKWR